MQNASFIVCASITLVLGGGCATLRGDAPSPGAAADGTAASDFTLRDLAGRTVRLSDYSGQVVLLAFFASWSRPSQAELPHLERINRAYQQQGFVVLGLAVDGPETVATVPVIAHRYEVTFPVLCDEETRVVAVYNPKRTTPLSLLIDRSGRIARIREGYNPGDERLIESDVQRLIGP
jgi:peroxiredoxin